VGMREYRKGEKWYSMPTRKPRNSPLRKFGYWLPVRPETQMLIEEVKTKDVIEEFVRYELGSVQRKKCAECEHETDHKLEARATFWEDSTTDEGTVSRRWICLRCRAGYESRKGLRAGPTARLRRKAANSRDE